MLGEEGYVAETAHDGRSALARALAEPFDLLGLAVEHLLTLHRSDRDWLQGMVDRLRRGGG